jgi:hypothetical protein
MEKDARSTRPDQLGYLPLKIMRTLEINAVAGKHESDMRSTKMVKAQPRCWTVKVQEAQGQIREILSSSAVAVNRVKKCVMEAPKE